MQLSSPGVVTVKVNKDAEEQQFNIHKCADLGLNGQSFYEQRGWSISANSISTWQCGSLLDPLVKISRALHLLNENPNAINIRLW